jgi:hypothetical protein
MRILSPSCAEQRASHMRLSLSSKTKPPSWPRSRFPERQLAITIHRRLLPAKGRAADAERAPRIRVTGNRILFRFTAR